MKVRLFTLAWMSAFLSLTPLTFAESREMNTDRPDSTESPITVPKGFFQIETQLASYARDGDAKAWAFGEFNFKYGLTECLDLQLIVPTWQRIKDDGDVSDGFGDLTLRAKFNLWGNDGGKTAFGFMPFVSLPTGSHGIGSGDTEVGLIIPLAVELPAPFGLGMMTEIDAAYEEDDDEHYARWINSIVLGIDLTESIGTYLEFVSVTHFDSASDWEGYFSTGFTWQAIPDSLQLDSGIRIGVNEAAEDVAVFVGCSTRF